MLTLLRAVSPAGDPAAVAPGDGVRRWRQTHGLHRGAGGRGPRLLQLQQGDVVVEGVRVVVLVHHDALDARHMFGAPLCQHAKVGAPVTRVGESSGGRVLASN